MKVFGVSLLIQFLFQICIFSQDKPVERRLYDAEEVEKLKAVYAKDQIDPTANPRSSKRFGSEVKELKHNNRKVLSLKEAILEQSKSLAPSTLKKIQWRTDEELTYVEGNSLKVSCLHEVCEEYGEMFDALKKIIVSKESEEKFKFPNMKWHDEKSFFFKHDSKYYLLKNEGQVSIDHLFSYPEDANNLDFEKSSKKLAFTKESSLYVTSGEGEKVVASSTENGIIFGQAVHRYEFGISKGTFWSAKGDFLAFYKMDERNVTTYPIVNITTKPAEVNPIRYPMAGMQSHQVELGIYNVATDAVVYVQTGKSKDQYLTNVAWGPESKYIYIAIINRDQNKMDLNQYEVSTGKFVKTLFSETHAKYVEPEYPVEFLPGSNNEFIWRSERDGFEHVYHYNTSGKLIKQLTSGNWQVKDVVGFDNTNENLLVVGTDESGLNQYLYKTSLKKGKVTRLSNVDGVHKASLSPNRKYILDTYSSVGTPRVIQVIDWDGVVVKELHKAKNPMSAYYGAQTKLLSVKAKDGTILNGRLVLPFDFKEDRKYPVMVYVYGGPHVQLVQNRWNAGASLWMHYLANQGYLVFTLDSRGSDNRGRDFEQSTFRRLGDLEVDDQLVGVDYLKSLSYVDSTKLGVHGWSYGGYMTSNLMLRTPDVFQVGVAGGPVVDWKYYEIMYTERYMDTPESNPEGYDRANLRNYVTNLKGKLMMIHGAVDDVVVWQHSMAFLKECVEKEVQIDYFLYPEHPHNVRGKDRVHLMTKVIDYFKDNL